MSCEAEPALAVDATTEVGAIEVSDWHNGFSPRDITGPRGSTVAWGWILCDADGFGNAASYSVTFEDDPTQPTSSPTMGSGEGGEIFTRTFAGGPRTIQHRCTLHSTSFTQGEVGTVTVQ